MKNMLLLMIALPAIWATAVSAQENLSASITQDMLDLLEEEKLANEVYTAMYDKWQHHSFSNISQAEERHLELMKQLALDHKLTVPAGVEKGQTGIFQNPELQKLYDELLKEGDRSLAAALKVGARIEETDIRDLKQAIGNTENAQAVQTYTVLLRASENHLRAFQRNLDRLGETYTPQALSGAEYQAIISGKNSCAGDCCKDPNGMNKAACRSGAGKGNGPKRQKNTCCANQ